jgi:hypothetical protein
VSNAIGRIRKARRTVARRGRRSAMQPGPYPVRGPATIPECYHPGVPSRVVLLGPSP